MGYFITFSGEKVIRGSMSQPTKELEPEQRAAVTMWQNNLQTINDPFLLVLSTYSPDSELPYKLTHISPSYYSYYAFDQTDFNMYVRKQDLHRQSTYKLVYVREGELYQLVENQRHKYSTGSCFLLNRNVRHNEEYLSPFSTISLFLSEQVFRDVITEDGEKYFKTRHLWNSQTELFHFFEHEINGEQTEKKSYIDFIRKTVSDMNTDPLHHLFDQLADLIVMPAPGSSFLFLNLICRIFLLLSNKEIYTTTPLELGSETEGRLFSKIRDILEENSGRISREALSRELCYSGSYLNRIVKKYTGMNITNYATSFTMKRAAWLLLHSQMTISDIAFELGFTNRTVFYQAFERSYGETPRQYRIRNQERQ